MKKFLWLLVFIPFISKAQDSTKVNISNPHATIYTHLYFLQDDTYEPVKASKTILGFSQEIAIQKAIKLKKILDGKGLYVDFNKVPKNPNYNDTIGYVASYKYVIFPERMPSISVERVNNNWYYSSETVNKIDKLYKEVYPWYVEKLQNIMPASGHKKIFTIELWQWIGLLLMLIIAYIIFLISKKIAFFFTEKTSTANYKKH